MKKYFQVFITSFNQEIIYRMNFIMWRFRNVLQFLLIFFLWDVAFSKQGKVVFGYDREKIFTYIFAVLIVRAFVLSSKTMDVAGEISRGEILNYFLKPVSYFKYWFTRDIASKALNLGFVIFEVSFLYLILRPPFFLQPNPLLIIAFLVAISIGILIYTILLFIVSAVTFWAPEVAWGAHFLVSVVVVEFLSGALYPLDVFPSFIRNVLLILPFQYLVYFPIQLYLGKLSLAYIVGGLFAGVMWIFILSNLLRFIWGKGMKVYQAYGR